MTHTIFSHKRIKTDSRRFDRLYRTKLSGFRMEPAHSSSSSEKGKALLASNDKRGAVVVAPKTLIIFTIIAGLIGGIIAWQMSRPIPRKVHPSQTEQSVTDAPDSVVETLRETSQRTDNQANSTQFTASVKQNEPVLSPTVETQNFVSLPHLENIDNQQFFDSTQKNQLQSVTFGENNVFNSEQENLSSMDSIKKAALATMMIMALNATAPAQVDSSTDYQQTKTEIKTSAQEDPDWRRQFKRHEFTIGIGDPARVNFHRNRRGTEPNYYPEVWMQNQSIFGDLYTTCPITLGYRFRVLKWLWVGGDVSYCGFFGSFRDLYTDQKVGDYRDHFISIMPAVRFSYLNRKYVTLYSGIAGGIALEYGKTYPDYKFHNNHLALQCTLFGVSAGSQSWFGFAELGWGFKGYVNAGFGFRFQSKKN